MAYFTTRFIRYSLFLPFRKRNPCERNSIWDEFGNPHFVVVSLVMPVLFKYDEIQITARSETLFRSVDIASACMF